MLGLCRNSKNIKECEEEPRLGLQGERREKKIKHQALSLKRAEAASETSGLTAPSPSQASDVAVAPTHGTEQGNARS